MVLGTGNAKSVYHLFVIKLIKEKVDGLSKEQGIETGIIIQFRFI